MSTAFTERDLEKSEGYDEKWGTDEDELVCVEMEQAGSSLVVPITTSHAGIPEIIGTELKQLLMLGEDGNEATIRKTIRDVDELLDMAEFRGW